MTAKTALLLAALCAAAASPQSNATGTILAGGGGEGILGKGIGVGGEMGAIAP